MSFVADKPIPEQETIITMIHGAMQEAETVMQRTAGEHLRAFIAQMREIFGADAIALHEPHLKLDLAGLSLEYVRILDTLEQLAHEKPMGIPQVRSRLDTIQNTVILNAKQTLDGQRQQAFGIKKYIWHTMGDDRVRPEHAVLEGKIFDWGDGEAPGDAPGCRCTAEPTPEGAEAPDKIEPVYPIEKLILLVAALQGRIAAAIGKRVLDRATREETPQKPAEPVKPVEKPTQLPKPDKIPKDWKEKPSRNEKGVRYQDPKNPHNEVRVQKGDPKVSNPRQQEDYVKWKHNGQWLNQDGKPVAGNSPDSHIPIEDFKFDPEIFK